MARQKPEETQSATVHSSRVVAGWLSVFVRVCRACAIFSAVAKMVSPFTGLSSNQKVAASYWLPGFIE